MANRKLVEISSQRHERFDAIRKQCREAGNHPPSIPSLVDLALESGLPKVEKRYAKQKAKASA